MKKIKKFSLFLSLTFLLSISWTLSFAYQGQLPEIYISEVKTDKVIYTPGDTIKGTFLIRNYDAVVAPSIYYELRLTGDYKDTIAQTGYNHTDMNGPLTLGAKESRTISFEYKLPATLSGKGLGIQVQSMLENGLGMGWGDSFFEVTGTSSFINIDDAYITKSSTSTEYALQQGPMIYKGDKSYVNIEFNNPNTTQDIYPKLTIYDRSEARNTLLTKDESVITIKAKSITKAKLELPVFDYVPKVYVGKLEFLNKAGEQVSNTLDFRYIVFGQMITINNVISDKEYANEGDIVSVFLNITGAPFDIDNQDIFATSTGKTEIKLFNENNIIVGEKIDTNVDFNKGEVKTYPIQIKERAKTLRAEIKVYGDQDNKILGEMEVNLTKTPMSEINTTTDLFSYIFIVVIVLLILLSIWFFIKRKSNITLIFIFIVLILIGVWYLVIKTEKSRAWVCIQCYVGNNTYSNLATFFINYPAPDQRFDPGASITVQAQASMVVCGNQPVYNIFYVWNDNDRSLYAQQLKWTYQVRNVMTSYYYSLPFVLASTAGAHNLMGGFYVSNQTSSEALGYQPYIINGRVDGVCGPAATTYNYASSSFNGLLCSSGAQSPLAVDFPAAGYSVNWNCNQQDGGTSSSCTATHNNSFSAFCSVSPTSATTEQTVTWTATSTGAVGTTTYSWTGDEFSALEQVNGKTTASVSGIYETSGVKHATVTVGDGVSTSIISCPGTSAGGVGDGAGITITDPTHNGECVVGGQYNERPNTPYLCLSGTSTPNPVTGSGSVSDPWSWSCFGDGLDHTDDICTATKLNPLGSNLTCTLNMNPYLSSVSVNHGTNWVATSTDPNLTIQKTRWAVNGLGTTTENGLVLNNKIFTTIGLKTVTAELASTTDGIFGPPCTATTTVVLGGAGGVMER